MYWLEKFVLYVKAIKNILFTGLRCDISFFNLHILTLHTDCAEFYCKSIDNVDETTYLPQSNKNGKEHRAEPSLYFYHFKKVNNSLI
jgi:hypothetical protein